MSVYLLFIAAALWPNRLKDGIAFCDEVMGDVIYRYDDGRTEIVDKKGAVGKYLSAIDGPRGPELVYLDQGRKVLRHAQRHGGKWIISDIAWSDVEIGVAARFVIGPDGVRTVLHFTERFALMMTDDRSGTWQTRRIEGAAGTYQSRIGVSFDPMGGMRISYPDQNIGLPAVRTAYYLPNHFESRGVHSGPATETELLGDELFWRQANGDLVWNGVSLANRVESFRALTVGGALTVVARVENALQVMWRVNDAWESMTVAQAGSFDAKEGAPGTLELAVGSERVTLPLIKTLSPAN